MDIGAGRTPAPAGVGGQSIAGGYGRLVDRSQARSRRRLGTDDAFVEAFSRAQRNLKSAVYKAKGGNQRIPDGMARRVKGGVRLRQTVAAIAGSPIGVTVHTGDGARARCARGRAQPVLAAGSSFRVVAS